MHMYLLFLHMILVMNVCKHLYVRPPKIFVIKLEQRRCSSF